MSRTGKGASDSLSDSSRTPEIAAVVAGIGDRLRTIRSQRSQGEMAAELAVSTKTYGLWERSERTPDAAALVALGTQGWNVHWIVTGDGPEQLEGAFQSHSQDMSPTDLSMAIQLANEKIAASGLAPSPEQYGKFVLLLYQVLHGGLPDAEIHDFPG